MAYMFQTVLGQTGLGPGLSSITFFKNKTSQKNNLDPFIHTFWWINILKDTSEKLMNILLKCYLETSLRILVKCQRKIKRFKTNTQLQRLPPRSVPALFLSFSFSPASMRLLNSKRPQDTCSQGNRGRWKLIPGLSLWTCLQGLLFLFLQLLLLL